MTDEERKEWREKEKQAKDTAAVLLQIMPLTMVVRLKEMLKRLKCDDSRQGCLGVDCDLHGEYDAINLALFNLIRKL